MTRDFAADKKDVENRYLRSNEGIRTELRSRHADVDKQDDENKLIGSRWPILNLPPKHGKGR